MSDERQGQDHGAVEDQMTNPSLEYMRRIRREEQDKLLGLRRERAEKALRSLDLHGGSHAMLSQIAYAIHPHIGAWDAGSCDHLRNVLAKLIGGACEAKSDAQRHCACGAGGCHSGDEQTALETERQEAVSRLRGTFLDTGGALKKLATALGVHWNADNTNKSVALMQRRLIHLLGVDQSDDSSPMRQESETGITDEPDDDERYVLDTSRATTIGYEPDALVITNGEDEVRITNGDTIIDGISVVGALDEVASGRLPEFAKKYSIDYMQREIEKLCDELEVRKAHIDRMQDEIMELRKVRDELKEDLFKYDRSLTRSEMECRMYLDLLRDAAKDYKALQDKIVVVFGMWANVTITKGA